MQGRAQSPLHSLKNKLTPTVTQGSGGGVIDILLRLYYTVCEVIFLKKFMIFSLILALLSLCGCSKNTPQPILHSEDIEVNIQKGINLSGLEGAFPSKSYIDSEKTFAQIAEKGFDHVRLPVDFRKYADENGVIKNSFYKRLDKIINTANSYGLVVMLDFHGWYDISLLNDGKLFFSIWENVAEHYKDYSNMLMFELINEPHTTEGGDLDASFLKSLQETAVKKIRAISPHRTIVLASADWNATWSLHTFNLTDVENTLVAVHIYDPLDFTHQGMEWAGKGDVSMPYNDEVDAALDKAFKDILEFKQRTGMKIVINEFGVNTSGYVSDEDVCKYFNKITSFAKENDIAWTYWEYNFGFGLFKPNFFLSPSGKWRETIVDALFKAYK